MASPTLLVGRVTQRAQQVLQSSGPGLGAPGRPSPQRRRVRQRRTVLVVLAALLVGTCIARWAQDPSVAVPRTSSERGTPVAATVGYSSGDVHAAPAREVPAASAPPDGQQPDEAEDAAPDPTAVSGPAQAVSEAAAKGTLHAVSVPAGKVTTVGRSVRYSVEIEDGVATGAEQFAAAVQATLADSRGWQTAEGVQFVPVSPEELAGGASVDIRVTLATPALTARLCAPLNTAISQVSCWNRSRAVLNLRRWVGGSPTYGGNLSAYRTYLVNHEVGHGLGHQHRHCPGPGQPAPIMVQQTKSLEGCTAWSWPTPP